MAGKWTPFATVPLLLVLLTACDLPVPKSYRLVLQLIEANGVAQTDPRITDVVRELDNTLQLEGYSLKSEIDIALEPDGRSDHEAETGTRNPPVIYTLEGGFRATVQATGRDDDQTLRLRVDRGSDTVLETAVALQPGRTLVLGSVPQADSVVLIVVRMIED